MSEHYYLVTQLPPLAFNRKTYLTTQRFLEEAEKWLSDEELRVLGQARLDNFSQDVGVPGLKEYCLFEKNLRASLALFRKEGKALESDLAHAVAANPLQAEINLLLLRWKFIENLESGHYFDLRFLICYYLKLQIVERLQKFNKEQGINKFDQVCEVNL